MKRKIFAVIIIFFGVVSLWYARVCYHLPTISVVMPTYNRIDLLPRSIESILNQTYQNFEFIIVDDGLFGIIKRKISEFA